jgi:hypothetical protein
MRRDAGLAVSDRIHLYVSGDALVLDAAGVHRGWIAEEVLATELTIGGESQHHMLARQTADLDGIRAGLALTRDE